MNCMCESRLDERERDGRLEVAGYEVRGCRDVVGVRDVRVSMRERVFLCVADIGYGRERGGDRLLTVIILME